ncbi:hypothetical protein KFZ70_07785 [Tamlana fucoidanivorans]|uniref:Secreted protein n=1 Tax=Allotamlana fucoidanivorans TaxID=2583814 RepID=A0A5C4SJE3_9FLAO|nr:hypothetical protein [Tamlana fucoidanivorans]TNJ43774.1 hypothetical protein FGF67_10410 [Tamlana fucoidanivorans]
MKTRFFTVVLMCFMAGVMFAQKSINNYKYVIVPNKFDFLKEKDQYQLNSLTKFLFNKYGFEAIMEGGEYPEDLNFNRCLALKTDVNKDSGMFKTKLTVILKDCNERVVYTSEIGDSREKEFKKAYNEALRHAFNSIEALNYKYEPVNDKVVMGTDAPVSASTNDSEEVKALKQEIETLKNKQEINKPAVVGASVVALEAANTSSKAPESAGHVNKVLSGVLYAQKIENGYQLVDSTPKVVYKLKQTHLDNVFLVENKSAIVFKQDEHWVVEYYENNTLKQQKLTIKFF